MSDSGPQTPPVASSTPTDSPRGMGIREITRCVRALFYALQSSQANDPGLFGAKLSDILGALADEFGTPDQTLLQRHWDRFLALVARSLGDRVIRGDQLVIFQPNVPNTSGGRSFMPEVFHVLRDMCEDTIPRTLLNDLYRRDLLKRYRIQDTPAFLTFALRWMDSFNRCSRRGVSFSELCELGAPSGPKEHGWSRGLIEAINSLSIIRVAAPTRKVSLQPRPLYHVHQRIDPTLVLCTLFGRSTGVAGLDYLLFGGLWTPGGQGGGENLAVGISGGPGLGKSTLAMRIASQVAARGGAALYLHFQLNSRTLERQLTQFHRGLLRYCDVIRLGEGAAAPEVRSLRVGRARRGLLAIAPMPTAPHQLIKSELLQLIAKVSHLAEVRKLQPERLVVFDSISACRGYGQPVGDWREFLDDLAQHLRARNFNSLFLVEREGGIVDGFENYLVDLDIRLGSNDVDGYLFRTLRIAKSRWQGSHRGEHHYTLGVSDGFQVYPSSAAVITIEWKREPFLRRADFKAIDPGIENFTQLLGRKEGLSGPEAAKAWWSRGSATALIGPRGTLKTTFGAAFCEAVSRDHDEAKLGASPCALFLHFSVETHEGSPSSFSWKNAQPSSSGARYDVPLRSPPGDAIVREVKGHVVHVFFRSGFLTPGQVFQVLRDLVREKRREGSPIRRAVVVDAGNIVPDFPALNADLAFIPALCSILSSEAITTLLIYSYPEHGGTDYIIDQVRSTSQNIIRCQPIQNGGVQSVAVFVERSMSGLHNRGIYELIKSNNTQTPLCLANTLDLVLDPLSKKPATATIKLMLHAETELQHRYHKSVQRLHKGLGPYQVEVLGHPVGMAHYDVAQEVIARERALWITQLDAYAYLDFTTLKEGSRNILMDLAAIDERVRDRRNSMVCLPQSPAADVEPIRSLPFYLNPSFLFIDDGLLAFLRDKKIGGSSWTANSMDYSWYHLLEGVRLFLARPGAPTRTSPAFDCPLKTGENVNCLFLEILASCMGGASAVNELPLFEAFGASASTNDGPHSVLVEAAALLWEAFHETFQSQKARRADGRDPVRSRRRRSRYVKVRVNPEALIQRHWYSTCRETARLRTGHPWQNPGFEAMRLPTGVWTCGDWHLGILEGSIGPRSGTAILLDEFLTPQAALERLVQGVGLPPHKHFYDHASKDCGDEMPVLRRPLTWFQDYVEPNSKFVIHRSQIPGYRQVSPILYGHLCAILSLPKPDAKAIRGQFLSLHAVLSGVKRSIS